MKMRCVYMLISSLGWDFAEESSFMQSELPFRYSIKPQIGSPLTVHSTALSGETPCAHGRNGEFYYDSGSCPLKIFKCVKYLFGAGLHPKCLFNTHAARRVLSRAFSKRAGYSELFNTYYAPFEKLSFFSSSRKTDILSANGLSPARNLRDVLEASGLNFHILQKSGFNAETLREATDIISSGSDFTFLYIGGSPENSTRASSCAKSISKRLEICGDFAGNIVKTLKSKYHGDWSFTLFSDFGVLPSKVLFDAAAVLKKLPLKFGFDFLYFIEPDMLRFWYPNHSAASIVRKAFGDCADMGFFLSDLDKEENGINSLFGDDVFVVNDGVQLSPSWISKKPLEAVRGYSTSASNAFLLSSKKPSFVPTRTSDIFKLMKSDIDSICRSNSDSI